MRNLSKTKRLSLVVLFLVVCFSVVGNLSMAEAADKIVLKYVSASSVHNAEKERVLSMWVKLEKDIAKASEEKIVFKHIGGKEIFGFRETLEAVRLGNLDAAWNPPSFIADIVPEIRANHITMMTQQERRKNGFVDTLNEILHEHNLHYLMNMDPSNYADSYAVFLNKCISSFDELSGKKVRAATADVPMWKSLGAIPIQTKTGDVYSALERGLVKGFGFPITAIAKYKFEEVVDYYLQPGYASVDYSLFINYKKWQSLPEKYRKLIMDEINKAEHYWVENDRYIKRVWKHHLKELEDLGIKRCTLSNEEGKKLNNAYYDALWDDIEAKSPVRGAKLRKLVNFK